MLGTGKSRFNIQESFQLPFVTIKYKAILQEEFYFVEIMCQIVYLTS